MPKIGQLPLAGVVWTSPRRLLIAELVDNTQQVYMNGATGKRLTKIKNGFFQRWVTPFFRVESVIITIGNEITLKDAKDLVSRLHYISELERLTIIGHPNSPDCLDFRGRLESLEQLENLTSVELRGLVVDGETISVLAKLPSLKNVKLEEMSTSGQLFDQPWKSRLTLTELRLLDVLGGDYSGVRQFENLEVFKVLWTDDVDWSSVEGIEEDLPHLTDVGFN